MEKENLLDEILNILLKESEIKFNTEVSQSEKVSVFNALMITRPVGYLDEEFLKLQDKYLKINLTDNVIDVENLAFKNKIADVDANMFDLKTDMLVVFSKNLLSGANLDVCDIDNQLVLKAGLQFNEDLSKEYIVDKGVLKYDKPYIVKTDNLHSSYVAKLLYGAELMMLTTAVEKVFDFAINKNLKNITFDFNNLYFADVDKIKKEIKNISKNKKYKQKLIFNLKK